MSESKLLIHSLSRKGMDDMCAGLGQPAFRARQIWDWLYEKRVDSWAAMRNLPKALADKLSETYTIKPLELVRSQSSPEGAVKLLMRVSDGEHVEQVIIPAPGRNTVCLSSQVGCKYRCAFCASGVGGFTRNLECGEIVGQLLAAIADIGTLPSNIVFMGIGEPMDNYDNVIAAIRIFNDKDGLNIGARRMTISTSGIVPGILRLAGEGLQVELSVSLHAPNDELRSTLMPVNRRHGLVELMDACRQYFALTGRILTFEYTLIRGVNDSAACARELVSLLRGVSSRVNLIPLSPVKEYGGEPSRPETARAFMDILTGAGINTTLRISKGGGVNAACGQLRSIHEAGNAG